MMRLTAACLALLLASAGAARGADVALDGQPILDLAPGHDLVLAFDATTPSAPVAGKPLHYRRVGLETDAAGMIELSVVVPARKQASGPRFTVFAPQLVLLGGHGEIRTVLPLEAMELDIRPFQPTRLRQCFTLAGASDFLVVPDPARLGTLYAYHPRAAGGAIPDHGFHRRGSPMQIFLTWADVGDVEIHAEAVDAPASDCPLAQR